MQLALRGTGWFAGALLAVTLTTPGKASGDYSCTRDWRLGGKPSADSLGSADCGDRPLLWPGNDSRSNLFLLPTSGVAPGAGAIARGNTAIADRRPSAPRAIPPDAIAQGWWHIGPIEALDAFQAPTWLPPLPRPGSTLRIVGAQVCYRADDCSDLKLERQKLADGPGRARLPALLGLAPDWPFYAVSLNDRAAFGLVRGRDGVLIALSDACDDSGTHCGFVRQVWTAIPDGA